MCRLGRDAEIQGFYKGSIYCSSLAQAKDIEKQIGGMVRTKIGKGLEVSIKGGCSEYYAAFRGYEDINQPKNLPD